MKKAFIFDNDGVLIDSERVWEELEEKFLPDLLGKEVNDKIGQTIGISIKDTYEKAVGYGYTGSWNEFFRGYDAIAQKVYAVAPITPGIEDLAAKLHQEGYLLAVVSASPKSWVDTVLDRVSFKDKLAVVLSIHERPNLRAKPAPDGYTEVIRQLQVEPKDTIILEDSNPGIAAAKASGAFTIALKQNLLPHYVQQGADVYAETVLDVLEIIRSRETLEKL